MQIKLYNTNSPNNTINKKLYDERIINLNFQDIADIRKPEIKIRDTEKLEYNYAYIPDFNSYYFITDTEIYPANIHTIYLEIDVLETYKNDILSSEGIISKSEYSNKYYDGGDYRTEERQEHILYQSDVEPVFQSQTILVTIGG